MSQLREERGLEMQVSGSELRGLSLGSADESRLGTGQELDGGTTDRRRQAATRWVGDVDGDDDLSVYVRFYPSRPRLNGQML
jgi:hypothetical protein